MGDGLSWAATW